MVILLTVLALSLQDPSVAELLRRLDTGDLEDPRYYAQAQMKNRIDWVRRSSAPGFPARDGRWAGSRA